MLEPTGIFKSQRPDTQSRLSRYAHKMKRKPTPAEKVLIAELDRRGIYYKFQKFFMKIGENTGYIADFYFTKTTFGKLVVEIDGSSHAGRSEYDARRTAYLVNERGCRVIRFTNEDVFRDVSSVVDAIEKRRKDKPFLDIKGGKSYLETV